jgi:peptide/nickel transport system substrate-binding protein
MRLSSGAGPRVLAAGAALLALAACGGGGGDKAGGAAPGADANGHYKTFAGGPPGGTLIVLADREPDELNPLTFDSNPAFQVVHLVFRALARRDSTLSGYQPDLLQSWETRPDSTLVLHLRPDVKWHDGVPVRAEDVVFTINAQKDPKVASPRKPDLDPVTSATAQDSLTVLVRFNQTGPSTVNALLELVPVPKHILGTADLAQMRFHPFGRKPVGDGLFRFASWNAGQQVVVEANPDAPEGRPSLDRVVLRIIPDNNAAMTMLLSGQGDLLRVPSDQRARLQGSQSVKLYHAPRVRPAWIAWNVSKPPMNDIRVRQALLMAVDRPGIVKGLFAGAGEPALTPIPASLREHSPDVRPIPFDPAGAGRLLDAAGWRDTNGDGIRDQGGRPLRIEVDYSSSDPTRQDVLVAMQAALRKVGVDLSVHPYESTAWVQRLRERQFQGSFWGWGWGPGVMGPNAQQLFGTKSIPPGGPNFAGYSNPKVDALLDSILVQTDTARARPLWRALEQQVTDDAVYAPIFMDPEFFGVHSRFDNVKFRGIEWWEDVPYWSVPANKRLPRDRGGR